MVLLGKLTRREFRQRMQSGELKACIVPVAAIEQHLEHLAMEHDWRSVCRVAAAVAEMWRGRLSVGAYVKSLFSPVESAIFAADDPLPALLELPLGAYVILKRHWIRLRRNANAGSDLDDCVSRVNGQENLT